MIEILLLSGTFMIVMLIGIMMLVVQFRRLMESRDEEHRKRIAELAERIDETQQLFRKDVAEILNNFKKLLK